MNYRQKYEEWLNNPFFDQEVRGELAGLTDEKEIEDRFYRDLEFGTGGLRGVIGYGTNRMNKYTVRKATQGLANYILKFQVADPAVAIAFDSRIKSEEFAREAALCLNANGIKAYVFDSLRPTPELSFAVRRLGCIAGIVITASHNPREYNGYKVYWQDGAQITPPHDRGIMDEIDQISSYDSPLTMECNAAKRNGLYIQMPDFIDEEYIANVKAQAINPKIISQMSSDIKIVYTPLHGTGNIPVRRILKELGFEKVYVVPEQEKPDGNFPTVEYPNPESEAAFELALKLAKDVDADIILATDPDADRLGVYAKDKDGNYLSFTGNMSGVLIANYILTQKELKENAAVVETIVTTDMLKAIAKDAGVKLFEVLTGFKYIGEKIKEFQEDNSYDFVFGMEESYGCLAGTYARDKDACVAVMMLCDLAAWCKYRGMTLVDQMEILYQKYGYYKEGLETLTYKGIEGAEKIRQIIDNLRANPPRELAGYKVICLKDYKTRQVVDLTTGEKGKTDLPESNVLYFQLNDNAWCCVRPSGTEPKIKFYFGVKGENAEDSQIKLDKLKDGLTNLCN
ncbi:MAG: phospho-sugar mutase [Pseudobutyrivibrio sp.]|nr:phospho-sugar mutase [Pseudobutyrivibrio sp.]